jgi:hypothetical protein
MMMAGQRVADQDGIAARGIERAIGFKTQLVIRQYGAAGQMQRGIEYRCLRLHDADGPCQIRHNKKGL